MKIGIVGCAGRMGRMLINEVLATDGCNLAGGTEREGSDFIGVDLGQLAGAGETGIACTDDAAALFTIADAIIDFTLPVATTDHAALALEHGVSLIIGTTGLNDDQQGALDVAARRTTVVQAANFSVGVNLLLGLAEQVAGVLDESFDIEIIEMHHKHKVDAPSGTALAIGKAAAAGRGVNLDDVAQRVRDGHTGERRNGDIGFATLRGGDVAGEHTAVFAGAGERIELTHKAASRVIFARGAVRAALWAKNQPPGLYSMKDVLGF